MSGAIVSDSGDSTEGLGSLETEESGDPDHIVLPDGSICAPTTLVKRYSRPFGALSESDKAWIDRRFTDAPDSRTPTDRDKDRILYSTYLHRLSGVTQVVTPPQDRSTLHSRLVHSLKVANLSREIASMLLTAAKNGNKSYLRTIVSQGGLDISACEAAGLAHDIGHPPFGHVAEEAIDRWLREGPHKRQRFANGFEGNAQSFRTLAAIERKNVPVGQEELQGSTSGLELTAVTLAAVLKYPWLRRIDGGRQESKFGAYHSEAAVMHKSREWFDHKDGKSIAAKIHKQTLEASIMDLADDITYAVHDLQDFILASLVPVEKVKKDLDDTHQLIRPSGQKADQFSIADEAGEQYAKSTFVELAVDLKKYYSPFFDAREFLDQISIAKGWLEQFDDARNRDDLESVSIVRTTAADIIGQFVGDIVLSDAEPWKDGPHVHLSSTSWHLMQILKRITKAYVIETPLVGLHQAAQISLISNLLEMLEQWYERASSERYLPDRFQALMRLAELTPKSSPLVVRGQKFPYNDLYRAIVDYCCSLTDTEALQVVHYLRGRELPRIV